MTDATAGNGEPAFGSRRFDLRPLAGEVEYEEQVGKTEPDVCATLHLAAVESDIKALNQVSGQASSIGLDERTREEILASKAVIAEILPRAKRERVLAAVEAGALSASLALGDHRTVVREIRGLARIIRWSPSLKEILTG